MYNNEFLKTKDELCENGALCACLSGSGPSIFGLFEDEDTAKDAKDELSDKYDNIFLCKPVRIEN